MKKLFTFLLLLSHQVFGQDYSQVEFNNRFYFETGSNKIIETERADAIVDSRIKGMGYGGTVTYLTVFSGESPNQFHKDSIPIFYLKVEDGVDPNETYVIQLGDASSKKRKFMQGRRGMYGKSKDISDKFIKLQFEKVEKNLYRVKLPKNLTKGEYAFVNQTNINTTTTAAKVSCFGVYEKK